MRDDGMDPKKRKNGDDDEEFDLSLGLSPPSQRRPRQQQRQQLQPQAQRPPMALSPPPPPPPHSWIQREQRQPPVQGEEEAPPARTQTLPFFSLAPRATIEPSHAAAAAALLGSSAMPVHPHMYGSSPIPLPTPLPQPYPAGGSSVSMSPSTSVAAAAPAFRARRNPSQGPRGGKDETIEPPFPWATDRRAVVHLMSDLLKRGIRSISGEVQCKRCEHKGAMKYDLEEKYLEVKRFIERNKHRMHDRAPPEWTSPAFPSCPGCSQVNSLKPVVAPKKRAINWLFMLLGQTLGCCTLEQLKYFCKHTKNHRTGAKDRVLYLTFLGICKQLDPIPLYNFDS